MSFLLFHEKTISSSKSFFADFDRPLRDVFIQSPIRHLTRHGDKFISSLWIFAVR